ncbi:hypothetical protein [Caudoviricetes sp.]|nr:hypothetical protein [Caudoviricetes sp.]
MAITDFVTVDIQVTGAPLTREGFGTMLVMGPNSVGSNRITQFNKLSELAPAFLTTGMPEYQAANAYFAQSPHRRPIKIGCMANKPTQKVVLSAITPTSFPNTTYKLGVKFATTATEIYATSDGTPTEAEILAALVVQLNGIASKPYTATVVGSTIEIVANTAGNFFAIEVKNRALLSQVTSHVDPGIAADLSACLAEDSDFYAVVIPGASAAVNTAAAAWCEANNKILLASTSDSAVVTAVDGGSDIASTTKLAAYKRTSVHYHPDDFACYTAALAGKCLAYKPGEESWHAKSLAGITPPNLTTQEKSNLTSKRGNSIESLGGRSVTFNGQCADGGFIDTVRGLDSLKSDIQLSMVDLLLSVPKIPYTDAGAIQVANVVRGALGRAFQAGIVDDTYKVVVPKVAAQSPADRANRLFPNVTFTAVLQGAQHKIGINGNVTQ